MKNFINFVLGSLDQTEDLEKLQSLLENTGIEVQITTNTSEDKPVSFLNIVYDDEVVRTKKKRNAGRKAIEINGTYTYGNIRELRKSMSMKEIAMMLGISERSLYRKIKENSSLRDDELFI